MVRYPIPQPIIDTLALLNQTNKETLLTILQKMILMQPLVF